MLMFHQQLQTCFFVDDNTCFFILYGGKDTKKWTASFRQTGKEAL
jgi:hypothetical protein